MLDKIKITARLAKSEADDEGLSRRGALTCMVGRARAFVDTFRWRAKIRGTAR